MAIVHELVNDGSSTHVTCVVYYLFSAFAAGAFLVCELFTIKHTFMTSVHCLVLGITVIKLNVIELYVNYNY